VRRLAIALSASVVLVASSCGNTNDSTPVACLEGTGAYLKALRAAPAEVTLNDGTPISGCLVENQKGGDLATVGTAMVDAATKLNSEALAQPGGDASLQLGYLLGAAQHGADKTNGIHAELIRRLIAAARYSPDNRPPGPAFMRAYGEGFDAGRTRG